MSLFHLVKFLDQDDREVAIVPGCWVLPDMHYCYWPTHGDLSWVQKAVVPEEWWPRFKIRVIQSSHDLPRLKRLEKKSLDYSDPCLTSDDNVDKDRARKRKRRTKEIWSPEQGSKKFAWSSDSHSSDEQDAPVSPLKSQENFRNPASSSQGVAPTAAALKPQVQTSVATLRKSFVLPLPPPSPSPSIRSMASPTPPSSCRSLTTGGRNQDGTQFERLFRAVEELKAEVQANSRKIDLLLLAQEQGRGSQHEKPALPDGFGFPLASVDDLHRLESLLSREESVVQKMVRFLASIGGRNLKDCVRRILATVVTNSLARQFNFFGLKGKKGFKEFQQILRTISESARKLYPDITSTELQHTIAQWLNGSRDRDHGKKLRELSRAYSAGEETQMEAGLR